MCAHCSVEHQHTAFLQPTSLKIINLSFLGHALLMHSECSCVLFFSVSVSNTQTHHLLFISSTTSRLIYFLSLAFTAHLQQIVLMSFMEGKLLQAGHSFLHSLCKDQSRTSGTFLPPSRKKKQRWRMFSWPLRKSSCSKRTVGSSKGESQLSSEVMQRESEERQQLGGNSQRFEENKHLCKKNKMYCCR